MRLLGAIFKGERTLFIPILKLEDSSWVKTEDSEFWFMRENVKIKIKLTREAEERTIDRELLVLDIAPALIRRVARSHLERRRGKLIRHKRHLGEENDVSYAATLRMKDISRIESYGLYVWEKAKNSDSYDSLGLSDLHQSIVLIGHEAYRTEENRKKKSGRISYRAVPYEGNIAFDHALYSHTITLPYRERLRYNIAVPRRHHVKKVGAIGEREARISDAVVFFKKHDARGVYSLALKYPAFGEIYELYVLMMIERAIYKFGFSLIAEDRYQYREGRKPLVSNTYVYSSPYGELTLYYEPRVGREDDEENGVALTAESSALTPDFVLKLSHEKGSRYLIVESKMKRMRSIKRTLEIKRPYTDLSTIHEEDEIRGLIFTYGERSEDESDEEDLIALYPTHDSSTQILSLLLD